MRSNSEDLDSSRPSAPSHAATEDEALRRTVERGHRLDDICIELGRDPASIARSFLVFESSGNFEVTPPTRAFSSEEAFRDLVGRYADIGMSELISYFPESEEHRAGLEKVAAVLPELRASWVPRATRSSIGRG